MYTSFLGLNSQPFQITPDPEFLFLSRVHKKAQTYLNYGISSDSGGFILITGEVGTGKTTIVRSIMKELKEDVIFARINNTRITSEQLIALINDDFGLDVKGKDKIHLLRELSDYLIEQYIAMKKSFLIIDEAQNLSADLLEEIRLLSNLETDKAKLLRIILVGQPELNELLSQPELRSFRQRITVSCHISPLTREETEQYIYHRLQVAGNRDAVIFNPGTFDALYDFARGIPRLINIICDFLLLSAFTDQTREISLHMVHEVKQDLERANRYWGDESCISREGSEFIPPELARKRYKSENREYDKKKDILAKVSSAEKVIGVTAHSQRRELENTYAALDQRLNEIVKRIHDIGGKLKCASE